MIRKRNIAAAKTRPLPQARKTKRPIGLAKGRFKISKKFVDPLPDEILNAFEGKP
jgi:antitoxin (DNA-binding transcriptional repressor) of toxin-antitoxin stability system